MCYEGPIDTNYLLNFEKHFADEQRTNSRLYKTVNERGLFRSATSMGSSSETATGRRSELSILSYGQSSTSTSTTATIPVQWDPIWQCAKTQSSRYRSTTCRRSGYQPFVDELYEPKQSPKSIHQQSTAEWRKWVWVAERILICQSFVRFDFLRLFVKSLLGHI